MFARTLVAAAVVVAMTSARGVAQEAALPGSSHSGSQILVRYQYDSEGRLIKKIGEDGIRQYVYDEDSRFLEYDTNGLQIAKYSYGADRLISLVRADEGTRFYHLDGLGSVTALTDPAGAVTSRLALDAWGVFKDPSQLDDSKNRFAFTGYVFDRETGLYCAKARFYDPTVGRFTSQDSFLGDIDTPPSLHRYFYGLNNPTRFVDPSGHQSIGAEFCRAYGCSSETSRQVDPLFAVTEKLQIAGDAVAQKAAEIGMGVSVAAANTLKALNSPGHQTPEAQREYYIQPETPTERLAAEVTDLALIAAPLLGKSSPKTPARANPVRVTPTHERLVVPIQEAMTRGESFTILEDGALVVRPVSGGSQSLDPAVVQSRGAGLKEPGGLRQAAVETHNVASDAIRKQMSTVTLAEVRLADGTVEVWATGSSGRLSAVQKQLLAERGVARFVGGKFHGEQNIGAVLPEGATLQRWGISWAEKQKPIPCTSCAPMVEHMGGTIER